MGKTGGRVGGGGALPPPRITTIGFNTVSETIVSVNEGQCYVYK